MDMISCLDFVFFQITLHLKGKAVYIMKKMPTTIDIENYKKVLVLGELSGVSFNQTSTLVEEVR